ncbi:hormogonium polysaccharide biosynthesis protein HpsL [Limnofasciculus baicalensis]|uniref:Hormogonium polysaccharide biosynthesis protein HpsL n=1 Tax=Limnofasciculus baicalensis BBK-W-15 TaxID=2699891 RepID=A0AAE3GU47_9CYAN|nr:hormogonium polysaccharide biosynthesis protein HpsL [Limnofasciculus baicalensis]MCP2730765.1 hormogonium polysaccharide biosynthesis protein HpsL [Limnofasciculus baicalensis BBK-W-15]
MAKLKSKSKNKSKKGKKQSKPSEKPTLSLKEQLAQKRKKQKEIQELIKWISISLIPGIFLGLIVGATKDPKMGIAPVIAIPCLVLSYKYPRQALWAFLIYMPFGGTVVYALGGNALLQLAKDAFYIPALLGLVAECKRKGQPILIPKALIPTFAITFVLSTLTLVFVNLVQLQLSGKETGQPFLQGILGLKIFLGYAPLIFCAYYLIEDKKQLLLFARLHLILAITCCALSLVQYSMLQRGICRGTDHLAGDLLFKASVEAKCFVGGALLYSPSQGVIRLPGTFVSPWHWGWFLISNSVLTFTVAFCDTSALWRLMGLGGMAIVFINAVICGQRIALALVPVVTVILLILTGQIANLKRFIPIAVGLGIVIAIAMATNPELIQERIASFQGRASASPPEDFIVTQFQWAMGNQDGFLGNGLGRGTNSTRTFGKVSLIETYFPKVIFEVGVWGFIGFMIFVSHLTVFTFKTYRSLKDKSLRDFGSCYWVFILIITYNTYWYPLDTDPAAVYYWFLAGVIIALPKIDKQEQEKLKLAEAENDDTSTKKRMKSKV